MKLVKMSLLAATLVASSAFAIDNTKVSGDARLYYGTNDGVSGIAGGHDSDAALFRKQNSYGQAAVNLGLTTDLTEGVSAGVATQGLTTLGLENNLVANTWGGGAANVNTQWWFSEMWVAATLGKTTAKVGRQAVDTPLAFTETWNIATNTFDAAVLLNQDIPDTTLVGAWIGKHNGVAGGGVVSPANVGGIDVDSYATFAVKGAYAAAVVNNSWKPLTVQAWYYDVVRAANAEWVQADLAMDFGLIAGVQFAATQAKGQFDGQDDSSAIAAKIGYTNADMGLTVSAAYSQTDKKGLIDISNVATGHTQGSQSKLYTEAWWNYGYVGAADMSAINVTAEYAIKDIVDLGLYITQATAGDEAAAGGLGGSKHDDLTEAALSASKAFGPLDTSLVFIYTDACDQNIEAGETEGTAYNALQVYLTYNF